MTVYTAVPTEAPTRCSPDAQCCGFVNRHAPALQARFWDVPEGLTYRQVLLYRPRFRCRFGGFLDVKQTFSAPVPQCLVQNPRVTRRLWEMVCSESHHLTTQEIARRTGLSRKAVWKIRSTYEKRLEELFPLRAPRQLGIDEAHIAGRAHVVLVDADASGKNRQAGAGVINVLQGASSGAVTKAIEALTDFGKIETFVIDMHRPYRAAIKAARPNAKIVVDRWHAQRLAVSTLTTYRRKMPLGDLSIEQRRLLKSSHHMFERRYRDLSAEDRTRVNDWCEVKPRLGDAYRAKEAFCEIWESATRQDAERAFGRWIVSLKPETRHLFAKTIRTVNEWREEILTYFELGHRITNGYTEAMNRRIKGLAREGSGLPFESLRSRVLQRYGERTYGAAYRLELAILRQSADASRSQQMERTSHACAWPWENGVRARSPCLAGWPKKS